MSWQLMELQKTGVHCRQPQADSTSIYLSCSSDAREPSSFWRLLRGSMTPLEVSENSSVTEAPFSKCSSPASTIAFPSKAVPATSQIDLKYHIRRGIHVHVRWYNKLSMNEIIRTLGDHRAYVISFIRSQGLLGEHKSE